ncbi:MAG TPA: rhodanese-like domain-containing protein, partial [Bryobacteraceae bacterium]|nr:rhodanese-like domain-containing protein [Bryobacteraceae bacterium]
GHIGGALHKPLDRLESMLGDLKRDRPIVVHCKGGYRSAIACSLIQRAGFENVTNLIGGLDAWQACGLAIQV